MTVPATARRAGPFNGNGVSTSFPFTFKIFSKSDIQVVRVSNGIQSTLVLDSDYSVTPNVDQDATPGGSVTYPISGSPLAVGETLSIVGALPYSQTTDLPSGGAYKAQVVEDALDRATFQIQQLAEAASRALGLPASVDPATVSPTLPAPESNKFIGWNAAATALQNIDPTTLATIVAFGTANADVFTGTGAQTAFTLSANPGSLNNLDVSVGGVTQLPGVDYNWTTGTTLAFTVAPPNGVKVLVRYQQGLATPDSALRADLANSANAALGDNILAVKSSQTSAQSTTQHEVNERSVHVFDFMTAAQIADVVAGTLTLDVTTAVQNFINAVSSSTGAGKKRGKLGAGKYKITASLNVSNVYCDIEGDGAWQTVLVPSGFGGSVIKFAANPFFKVNFRDFSIQGDATSGAGIDFSAVTNQVYDSEFERLFIQTGGACLYAPGYTSTTQLFSSVFKSIRGISYNSHTFHMAFGPSVVMIGCYAENCGANKAGYRLAGPGTILLIGCNGLNAGDYWGVFGQLTSASDGFQSDFPLLGQSFPDVQMIGCNVEDFTKAGIICHNSYLRFEIEGGTLNRSALSSAYIALIKFSGFPVIATNPARIGFSAVLKGTGVPNGGAALTTAWIYCASGRPPIVDMSGALIAASIAGPYFGDYASVIPFLTQSATNDVFGDVAHSVNALTTRRLSMQMVRYATPAALTPVGAGQTIDVTGYTKVLVTPAAAASITKATFSTANFVGSDYGRNGELIIEATNANLTINHTARGGAADTFIMTGGANLALAAGQIVRFLRSETGNQWQQV